MHSNGVCCHGNVVYYTDLDDILDLLSSEDESFKTRRKKTAPASSSDPEGDDITRGGEGKMIPVSEKAGSHEEGQIWTGVHGPGI